SAPAPAWAVASAGRAYDSCVLAPWPFLRVRVRSFRRLELLEVLAHLVSALDSRAPGFVPSLEISSEESEEGVFAAGGLAGFGAGGISGAGTAGSPKTLELRTAGGECQTVRRVVQPVSINQSHGQLRGNRSSRRRPVRMIRPATASNR